MEHTIQWNMSPQHAQYVMNVLAQRPYQETVAVIQSLTQAVQQAQTPTPPPNGAGQKPVEDPTPELN